jgi:hypothetical protein
MCGCRTRSKYRIVDAKEDQACPIHFSNEWVCRASIVQMSIEDMELGEPLGDGASGDVFAAVFQGGEAALKVRHVPTAPRWLLELQRVLNPKPQTLKGTLRRSSAV